jgi:probable rRNA maturation factor
LNVLVTNEQKRRVNRRRLARIAEVVMQAEGCEPNAELSVVIGDDEWIQNLNRTYLTEDRPTDVLAFAQDAGPDEETSLLGDVAISAETAARQAEEMGHSLAAELDILLVHGILHLTGWTDGTPQERQRMMQRATGLLSLAKQGQ